MTMGIFKLHFSQVLRQSLELSCTTGRQWGIHSSGNRRMAVLKRKIPVFPLSQWRFAIKGNF